MSDTTLPAPWLVLVFSLPAKSASGRVDVWRRLRKYGAFALAGGGYLLPRTPANEERLQWLAASIRTHKGEVSIIRAEGISDLPTPELVKLFNGARTVEYDALGEEIKGLIGKREAPRSQLPRLQRRLQDIVERDFFGCPARGRVEALMARLEPKPVVKKAGKGKRRRTDFEGRTWITRPRPGIDRVGSAWLIRRFIDANARFNFSDDPKTSPGAVPFDMFATQDGFGHEGDACTFETLVKEFGITDPRVIKLAHAIHDADLEDEKYGRGEAIGIARVLAGWSEQGVPDDELLRRGIDMIEGIYQAL
jgi:hypothetical protein